MNQKLPLTLILFISSNVDDLFLLHAWFSKKIDWKIVFLGQLIGIGLLVLTSILLAQGAIYLTGDNIKRLSLGGIIPLMFGIYDLFDTQVKPNNSSIPKPKLGILKIVGTTLANGSDNIALYTPFFLTLSTIQYGELCLVFFIMTGVWCSIAKYSSSFLLLQKISPYLLIGIGLYILQDLI